ncbi:hypothetical protein BTI679_31090 [Bacillus wiedmannii]|uniref:hypothetical protein n=1 Tax=Bacillus wiedmannii TaxID=1890302 RepID=UPI000CD8A32F|nr:hypothetical protein [Bacillus wiedmannii]MBG9829694.1 hypothetical protein [Bacillus wiedmannii]UOB95766.1 hypothetical protein BTI679_31090 [Bacillus wiedmannii]
MKTYKTNSKDWRDARDLLSRMLVEAGFVEVSRWNGNPEVRIINNTPCSITLEKLGIGITYDFTEGLSVWGHGSRYAGRSYSLKDLQGISRVIFLWGNKLRGED